MKRLTSNVRLLVKRNKDSIDGAQKSMIFIPVMFSIATSYVIVAKESGLNSLGIMLYASLMYAGTVQIAVLNTLLEGAGLLEVIVVSFMTSTRLGFIGMSIKTHFGDTISNKVLPFFSFLIIDPAAGIIPARAKEEGNLLTFSFSFLICSWLQWISLNWFVITYGKHIPISIERELSFAIPAIFIALTISMIRNNFKEGMIVVLIACFLALFLTYLVPISLASIMAAIIAALIGTVYQERGASCNAK